ncbi:MAG: hypothetical protein AB8I08_05545 [Sandaracinaceae bacterium]
MRYLTVPRRVALLFSLVVCLTPTEAWAQQADADEAEEADESGGEPENMVFADLSLGVISAGYERTLDTGITLALAAGIYGPWYRRDNVLGGGGELRLFLFPGGEAPSGVYVSPGIRAAFVGKDDEDGRREGFAFSGRVSLGYSLTWDILVVRLGFGMQMHVLELDDPAGAESDDFFEPFPVADIYVGLRF